MRDTHDTHDLTTPTLGERIAEHRRRLGLSQRDLAATVKRSVSWVSQVERDVLPVERLSVLQALARALQVGVHDLRPEAAAEPPSTAPAASDLDGLRLELCGHPVPAMLLARPVEPATADLDALHRAVEQAWELAHGARLAELNGALTGLLPRLEVAVRQASGGDAAKVHQLRARAYQAASAGFAEQGEPDAAWVAADRAIAAAEQSGEPLAVVAGHFRLAHAFLRLGRLDQAEHVADRALDALAPVTREVDDEPEVVSLLGAMHLVQAVIAGQQGDRATARSHLAAARRAAERLGTDRNDHDTEFGPTNVQLHVVAIAVDLGDAGEALDVAGGIDASGLSSERRTRLLVDVARAHAQRRQAGEALAALRDAEQLAPEQVHGDPLARTVVRDLVALFGRRTPPELVELGRRCAV